MRLSIVIVLATSLIASGPGATASSPPTDPEGLARSELAAARGESADQLELLEGGAATVPLLNEWFWAGKFADKRSGEIVGAYVDASGEVLSLDGYEARLADAESKLSPFDRKADPGLVDYIARTGAKGSTLVPVQVWIDVDTADAEKLVETQYPDVHWYPGGRFAADTAEVAREVRHALFEAKRLVFEAAEDALVTKLSALAAKPGYRSTTTPLVFAEVPAEALGAVAAMDEVVDLGLNDNGWTPALANANPTVQADWTESQGYTGNNSRVAIVEYYNVRANDADLQRGGGSVVVQQHSTSGTLTYDPTGDGLDHPTWVAGAVASQSTTRRGIAPDADLISSSTGGGSEGLTRDENVISATDWAIGTGNADIINTSLVQDTQSGSSEARKYFDSIVYQQGITSVSAAGNYGSGYYGGFWVGSPGTGWNVLTVGGTDDGDSAGWGNDVIWYNPTGNDGADFKDKQGTDFNPGPVYDWNKPNVAAPAVGVRTVGSQSAHSGTSIASPIVAGVAAQLDARNANLLSWPEATRALVMAGAVHHTPMPAGTTGDAEDHEGVGTVSAKWSNQSVNAGSWWYGVRTSSSAFSYTFPVLAGWHSRVVLVWDSHTSGGMFSKADAMTADFDLHVSFPDGHTVHSSSYANNYEWIEYTTSVSGTMTITVTAFRWDGSSEPYAIALTKWSTP